MDIMELNKYLREHQLFVDIQEDEGRFAILIEWGDWKHDHMYCDHLMKEIGYICIEEEITEEDGSDCYSAIHTYEPLKTK